MALDVAPGDVPCSGGVSQIVGAGNVGMVQLWNPDDSPVWIIVDWLLPSFDTADAFIVQTDQVQLTTLSRVWNSLYAEQQNGYGQIRVQQGAAPSTVRRIGRFNASVATNAQPLTMRAILRPGWGLLVFNETVGVNELYVTFAGRERPRRVF